VDDGDVFEADGFARGDEKFFEAGNGREIKAVHVAMASIEAEADGQIDKFRGELLDDCQFGEIAAELGGCASSVFEQDCQAWIYFLGVVNRAPGEGDSFGDVQHALFQRETFVIARMDN